MNATAKETSHQLEDALAYLPRKGVVEYRRGHVIYDGHPPNALSLVIQGRVKVAAINEDGAETVTGIFRTDEFFGEGTLIGEHMTQRQQATALEISTLMSWTRMEIEAQIERQPRLGLALIQVLAARSVDLGERLESLALDKMPERLAASLIRFARLGTRESDGAVRMPPLTHQLLSGYIGTSREVITAEMNQLRRKGFVRYSRKAIQIYPEALTEHLRSPQA